MISRYTLPEMEKVWSDSNKYDNWLKVEIAVCWALKEIGTIPQEDFDKIEKSNYDYDRLNEILEDTKHDMTAFLLCVKVISESFEENVTIFNRNMRNHTGLQRRFPLGCFAFDELEEESWDYDSRLLPLISFT